MTKLTKEAQAHLEDSHRMYCDYNQKVRSDCQLMVEKGHPGAAVFLELRGFFDTLMYASNSRARNFSYKNAYERAEYWAPSLDLSWYPGGELGRFCHVFPADPRWNEYIEACAAAGWPAEVEPKVDCGSWLIRTENRALRDGFMVLRDKHKNAGHFTIKAEIDESDIAFYRIDIRPFGERAIKLHRSIVSLLKKHQKAYVLPARTPEQNAADTVPLPLAEKKFTLANVKEVTVTDRHVMVPLTPIPADEDALLKNCNTLLNLVEEGFPFEQVSDWLKSMLQPESFHALEVKYAATVA